MYILPQQVKKATKKIEEEKQQAEQSNNFKTAFLANMAHEIRTPLSSIVGFSNLLKKSNDPKEKEEYAKIITSNNELLTNLVNDILDLSKIESGIIQLDKKKFDLAELFDNLKAMFEVRMRAGTKLVAINPYKTCMITSDKQRISQIMNNFVSNAIKYTPKGTIEIGYELSDEGGVKMYVKDTGIGISQANQNKVFCRFQKLDTHASGNGLGLSICKAIAEQLNGNVGYESEEGKGSTFWVWIPTSTAVMIEQSDIPRNEVKRDEEKYVSTDGLSILVAEDIDSNFRLIEGVLKGHSLERAINGVEAVEKASLNEYHLIIMDIRMPEMDGIEATRRIREFDKDIKIVALTANAFDIDKDMALGAGCNAFLTKPLKKEELLPFLT